MSTEHEREQAFVEEVRKTLRAKGEKLDPEVIQKLASIRTGVVEDHGPGFNWFWRMARVPAAAFMVATVGLVFTLFYLRPPTTMQYSLSVVEDVSILVAEEGPDFFADLDFYTWLSEAKDVSVGYRGRDTFLPALGTPLSAIEQEHPSLELLEFLGDWAMMDGLIR